MKTAGTQIKVAYFYLANNFPFINYGIYNESNDKGYWILRTEKTNYAH